jgi:hypothetical protein
MKTGGIIAIFFGVLNLIIGFASISSHAQKAPGKIGFGIGATILGLYLLSRAKQKEEEVEKKKKWENQSSEQKTNQ